GAAQTAADEHPSGSDMLKNIGEQGALYGGAELRSSLLQRAFGFLRGIRGVKQAASASAAETAAKTAAASTPSTPPKIAAATEKPDGDLLAERLGILEQNQHSLMTGA